METLTIFKQIELEVADDNLSGRFKNAMGRYFTQIDYSKIETRKNHRQNNKRYYINNGGGDEQYTPKTGVEILLPHIQHLKNKKIWCPFDKEDSHFVKVLQSNDFDVIFSHIEYGQDFFDYEPLEFDVIVSNPPYKNKRKFIERALSFNKPFSLLLPVNILSDAVINQIIPENDLQLFLTEKRMRFFNKKTGETGKQPTFKAFYLGYKFFLKQIILQKL